MGLLRKAKYKVIGQMYGCRSTRFEVSDIGGSEGCCFSVILRVAAIFQSEWKGLG